jgi:hypothetical protein
MIDTSIDLTDVCQRAEWHLATAVSMLTARGLTRDDAEAFTAFQFAEVATRGDNSADCVSDAQWDRLTSSNVKAS